MLPPLTVHQLALFTLSHRRQTPKNPRIPVDWLLVQWLQMDQGNGLVLDTWPPVTLGLLFQQFYQWTDCDAMLQFILHDTKNTLHANNTNMGILSLFCRMVQLTVESMSLDQLASFHQNEFMPFLNALDAYLTSGGGYSGSGLGAGESGEHVGNKTSMVENYSCMDALLLGKYEEALELLHQSMDTKTIQSMPSMLLLLAHIYLGMGQEQEAWLAVKETVQLARDYGDMDSLQYALAWMEDGERKYGGHGSGGGYGNGSGRYGSGSGRYGSGGRPRLGKAGYHASSVLRGVEGMGDKKEEEKGEGWIRKAVLELDAVRQGLEKGLEFTAMVPSAVSAEGSHSSFANNDDPLERVRRHIVKCRGYLGRWRKVMEGRPRSSGSNNTSLYEEGNRVPVDLVTAHMWNHFGYKDLSRLYLEFQRRLWKGGALGLAGDGGDECAVDEYEDEWMHPHHSLHAAHLPRPVHATVTEVGDYLAVQGTTWARLFQEGQYDQVLQGLRQVYAVLPDAPAGRHHPLWKRTCSELAFQYFLLTRHWSDALHALSTLTSLLKGADPLLVSVYEAMYLLKRGDAMKLHDLLKEAIPEAKVADRPGYVADLLLMSAQCFWNHHQADAAYQPALQALDYAEHQSNWHATMKAHVLLAELDVEGGHPTQARTRLERHFPSVLANGSLALKSEFAFVYAKTMLCQGGGRRRPLSRQVDRDRIVAYLEQAMRGFRQVEDVERVQDVGYALVCVWMSVQEGERARVCREEVGGVGTGRYTESFRRLSFGYLQ